MMLRALVVVALLFFHIGCQGDAKTQSGIVPGERVGTYVLRKSTLRDILGEDTADARKRFVDQGLNFEFNQGKELTAVTVSNDRFQMPNGLRVGSTVEEVEQTLGKPAHDRDVGEHLTLDVLDYPGITFIPKDGRVAAIRISRTGG
jgi:hypothetical protein